MDLEEFHKQLADAPLCFRRELRLYLRHSVGRGAGYITGYVSALNAAHMFKTDGAAWYWLGIIGRVERNPSMGVDLLAEMDNPPAGGAQAAEIEELREALKDIRSRSAMNFTRRLDPFDRLAELSNIHQIADAALSKENTND